MEMTLAQALQMLAYFSISVTFLILGWTLYYNFTRMHIPPGINQQTKLRLMGLAVSSILGLVALLEKVGICHRYVIWRLIINGILPLRTSDLIIKDLLFDTVPVRVYWPKTECAENRRGLIWIHGGGGLIGSSRSYERLCRFFAREGATVVVSIDYPLAPEHPYPAQQLSCYTAVVHFLKNAQDYGVDSKRILIAGNSSGGNVVAAISQQLMMRKDLPRVRGHVLLCPFLQALDLNLPSYQQNHSIPLLIKKQAVCLGFTYATGEDINDIDRIMGNAHVPEKLMAKYRKWISADHIPEEFKVRGYVPFVPVPFSEDLYKKCKTVLEPMFSPLLAEDAIIQQFPDTFLLTCEYDIFRDDGLLYKKRLEDNGVSVTWHHLEDGFHGMFCFVGLGPLEFPGTRNSLKLVTQFLEQF